MNLRQHIALQADASYPGYFETFQVVQPIPTAHPPSLKHPQKIKQPGTAQDGWRKNSSKRKKRRARSDMQQIVRKTLNQGRPTLVHHSRGSDPNLWSPSQIADL